MALQQFLVAILVAIAVVPFARAEHLECHMLPAEECSFAVEFSGSRCVLETALGLVSDILVCETSSAKASENVPVEYIESNECVEACGVDRMAVGFSTDELSSQSFVDKMCSRQCRNKCANLVDIYSNIIAGDGLTLAEFCGEGRRAQLMARRLIDDSSALAPAPL